MMDVTGNGSVIDRLTGRERPPTFDERLIIRDDKRRARLRAKAEKKKEAAQKRKRRRKCGGRIGPSDRRSFAEEITCAGHRFYQWVFGQGLYDGAGPRDQSWKRHRRTRWRREASV